MTTSYTSEEYALASEIATALNDRDSFALHIKFVQEYKEAFLRKTLTKVLAMDTKDIRRSRAALYTFLVKHGPRHERTWY